MKKNSGITLIALVITIIVLLILAGVTIAMLGGNNGTPAKANEASAKDAVAAAKDRINLVASDALLDFYNLTYVNDTSVGSTDVKEQAQTAVWNKVKVESNYEGVTLTPNDTKKTITVTSTKDTYVSATCTVKQGGGITWSDWKAAGEEGVKIKVNGETKTVTEANAKDYYGTTVATVNEVPYGLFYIDFAGTYSGGEEGTVYLRAKNNIGRIELDNPSLSEDALRIMKQLNPQWNAVRINAESLTPAEQSAEYLCNPAVGLWSSLQTKFEEKYNKQTGDDYVNYVIGGPSIELFLASYNTIYNSEYSAHFKAADQSYTYPGYLYSNDEGKTFSTSYSSDISASNKEGGMYVDKSAGINEWLASPMAGPRR